MSGRSKRSQRYSPYEQAETIHVRELDLDLIKPNTATDEDHSLGSSRIVIIGKPGSGKSVLIKSLLYGKRHRLPVGSAMSGTEAFNHTYGDFMAKTCVFHEYDEDQLVEWKERQMIAKEQLPHEQTWAAYIVDDCTTDKKIMKTKIMMDYFKNGRHFNIFFIFSLQYSIDFPPDARICIDGTFIMNEKNLKERKKLYENYGSNIPNFDIFCQLMDAITGNYTALYIHNNTQDNDWKNNIYYYRANPDAIPEDWQFGSDLYIQAGKERYDENWRKNFSSS